MGGYRITKNDPSGDLTVRVSIRLPDADQMWPGIWVDGEWSYDTYILRDGLVYIHSPVRQVGEATFEMHAQRGGGSTFL
jgi:hypothetical protein